MSFSFPDFQIFARWVRKEIPTVKTFPILQARWPLFLPYPCGCTITAGAPCRTTTLCIEKARRKKRKTGTEGFNSTISFGHKTKESKSCLLIRKHASERTIPCRMRQAIWIRASSVLFFSPSSNCLMSKWPRDKLQLFCWNRS